MSTPFIPSATNPANRGNLRLKSLSLRELDVDNSISVSMDLTVQNKRLQLAMAEAGVSTYLFSAQDGVLETATLSTASAVCGTLSLSSIVAPVDVAGDVSVTGDLVATGDITAANLSIGNAYVQHLEISGANTLSVGGNVIIDGGGEFKLSVSNFEVSGPLSSGSSVTCSELSVGGAGVFAGDVDVTGTMSVTDATTLSSTLTVVDATQLSDTLSVHGDAGVSGLLNVTGQLTAAGFSVISGKVVANDSLSVGTTATIGDSLEVDGTALFHDQVVVDHHLSVNQNASVVGKINIGGDGGMSITAENHCALNSLSAGTTTLNEATVSGSISIGGDLVVAGTTTTINSTTIEIVDPIIEVGTGTTTVSGIKIIKTAPTTLEPNPDQSGVFREPPGNDGTDAFFAVYEDFNESTSAKQLANFRAKELIAAGSVSVSSLNVGGHANVTSDADITGEVTLRSTLSVQGATHLANTLSVHGNTGVSGNLNVGADLTALGFTVESGVLSTNGAAGVGGTLKVSESAVIDGSLSAGGAVIAPNFSLINGTLSTNGDVTLSGALGAAEATVGGNCSIAGSITGEDSLVISELSFAKAEGTLQTVSGFDDVYQATFTPKAGVSLNLATEGSHTLRMEFDEMPARVTFKEDSKTSIEYTAAGTNTASAIAQDPTTGKFLVPLAYKAGTGNPVVNATSIEVILQRSYVSKSAFAIKNLSTGLFGHNMQNSPAIDAFTADSGHKIPTLSVAGDIIAGQAMSIGHDFVNAGNALFSNPAKRVVIAGRLSVNGDIVATQDVVVGGTLNIEAADVSGLGLATTGAATFIKNTLSVADATTLDSTLVVNGASTFTTIDASESAILRSTLSVADTTTIAGATTIANDLTVTGDADVTGAAVLGSTLSVNSAAFLKDRLDVTGVLSVAGDTALGNAALTGTLSVAGITTIAGATTIANDLTVTGDADVTGAAVLGSTLSVNSAAFLKDRLDVGDTISVDGAASLKDRLDVTGVLSVGGNSSFSNAALTGTLGVDGAATFGDTISVDGAASLKDRLDVTGVLSVGGDSSFSNAALTGTLGVDGAATFGDTISVDGAASLKDRLDVTGVLSVGGDSSFSNAALTGTLGVTGAATFGDTLTVDNTIIAGHISVGTQFVATELTTNFISTGTLFVQNSSLNEITGDSLSMGQIFVDHNDVSTSLSVAGSSLFLGDITANGMTVETVDGTHQLSVAVAHMTTAHIQTLLNTDSTVSGLLSVHTLFVNQVHTTDPDDSFDFQDDAHFQGDMTIEGKLYVKDILYSGSGGPLQIDEVAAIHAHDTVTTPIIVLSLGGAVPASGTATGDPGTITVDQQYFYLCIADNNWRRIAMSMF